MLFVDSEKIVCISRVSVCELEVDVVGADILNRHELSLGKPYSCTLRYWECC